jgi:hypothetical protein
MAADRIEGLPLLYEGPHCSQLRTLQLSPREQVSISEGYSHGLALSMLLLIEIPGGLFDRLVSRLVHRIHKRDAIPSSLGHRTRPRFMGAELGRVQPRHPAALSPG